MNRAQKIAAQTSQIIRVREYCGSYIASGGGKRASCTQGPMAACLALVDKLFRNNHVNLTALRETNTWRAVACKEES